MATERHRGEPVISPNLNARAALGRAIPVLRRLQHGGTISHAHRNLLSDAAHAIQPTPPHRHATLIGPVAGQFNATSLKDIATQLLALTDETAPSPDLDHLAAEVAALRRQFIVADTP